MAGDKPVREMDTILLRVPDGLKDRIAQRARANGRSMSSEVLSIIEHEMDEAGSTRMRELEAICRDLDNEGEALRARLSEITARREAAREELLRRQMVKKSRARKASQNGGA